MKPGVSPDASRAAVNRAVVDFPNVQVRDQAQFKQDQSNQINQVLVLFYLLLALSVVIAFIGIINTLALSVMERIRELALLRALGMTRGQLRAMIRWEAIIIAVFGALLGLVVGVFFGWTAVRALHSQGIDGLQPSHHRIAGVPGLRRARGDPRGGLPRSSCVPNKRHRGDRDGVSAIDDQRHRRIVSTRLGCSAFRSMEHVAVLQVRG